MGTDACVVIAEAGVNHNGSLDRAIALVDAGADAGANAVKFQIFRADSLVTRQAPKANYQVRQTGDAGSQRDMLKALELGSDAFRQIAAHCSHRGVTFLATPFDDASVDFLVDDLGARQLKVSSGDLTNAPLLLKMAQAGVPIILSTGMSTMGEIKEALGVIAFGLARRDNPSRAAFEEAYSSAEGQGLLRSNVTILHCTTEYPTPLMDVNLRAMDTLGDEFGLPVGYSDHTAGISVAIAAAARGAVIVEKHFTLDRSLEGPDHAASLEPSELASMIAAIRDVEVCLGSGDKKPCASELVTAGVARRSIYAARPIKQGETFSSANLTVRRPAGGRSPISFWELLGTRATRDYQAEEAIEP